MQRGPRDGAKTSLAIREAAASLFFEHGYKATSLRSVASAVGIQVGSLYNHINGKDELLNDIMVAVMDELEASVTEAVEAAGDSAVDRLRAAVDAHLRYHAQHAREVFIGNSELRSLNDEDRKSVLGRRRQYELFIHRLVEEAAKEADADLLDAGLQTYALLALGMHVSSWYKPRGRLSLERVVEIYTTMCLRQMGISSDDAPRR
jgi:TetR/AcrR family transcriptional regulator, cholesterol catabolism regulator